MHAESFKPLCLAIVVMASLFAAAPAASAVTEMSEQRAGQYYMRLSCTMFDAHEKLTQVLFQHGPQVVHSRGMTGRRLVRARQAARQLAAAQATEANRLTNPPAAWPSTTDVREPVRELSNTLLRTSRIFSRMGSARNGTQVARTWENAREHVRRAFVLNEIIRRRLDLPPAGRGCRRLAP
jgi:hypothetical protein